MREFLHMMQEAGTMRRDVDTRAVAFILDAITPALRRTFTADRTATADPISRRRTSCWRRWRTCSTAP